MRFTEPTMLRGLGSVISGRPHASRMLYSARTHSGHGLHTAASATSLTITRPDDWHLHVRDGAAMKSVVGHTARHFGRAIIMPNLVPPIAGAQAAVAYHERILDALTPFERAHFTPLMTCYLTDLTSPADVSAAQAAGVVAFKLYPAGATTNSDSGVTDLMKVVPTLKAMAEQRMPLLVHGEVTDDDVDMFDREAVFIHRKLIPLLEKVPNLKVVMEHITTKDAVDFVSKAPPNVAATITPQHMLLNRNALFVKGIRPHNYCLPILKREKHREAVAAAATSGSPKFFLGTDSAPHAKGTKGFASHHGPDFYGLPRNSSMITLVKQSFQIPEQYQFGDQTVVPMWAGQQLQWQVVS